jgi:hypothetical protein
LLDPTCQPLILPYDAFNLNNEGDGMIDGDRHVLHGAALCNKVLHMTSKVKQRISVGLTIAMLRELTAVADEAHVSVSWIGERAITEFLERHRNGEMQLPLGLLNDNRKGAA